MIIIIEITDHALPCFFLTVFQNIEIPDCIMVTNVISGIIHIFNNWDEVKVWYPFIDENKIPSDKCFSIEKWENERKVIYIPR